jgi:type I restriction enzyme, S subunit
MIEDFQLMAPEDVGEQRSIAHILGTLDDKIELNRRMNQTLEGIARALFKSWFVDFDPVRAKAEGCQPVGMDEETAALFSDSFQESELGLIPKGWSVKGLSEIAQFLNGLALQKFPPVDDESLPIIKIAQLRAGNTIGADRAGTNLPVEYVVHDGDVLFSWSGTLEVEIWCGNTGALNQHLFKVTSDVYPKWFYFFATREHLPSFREIAHGKATTMGHIQRRHLKEALVVCPPPELLDRMDRWIAPLLDRMVNASLGSRTLASIRDTLLPKLISGEIRIREAEKMLAEAPV